MLDRWRQLLGHWVQSNKIGLWVVGLLVATGGILILFEATEFVGYSIFIFAVLAAWILWPRKPKGGGGGEGSNQIRTRAVIVLGLAVGIVLTIVGFAGAAGAEGSVAALYPMFAGLAILAVILLIGIAQFIRNLRKRKR